MGKIKQMLRAKQVSEIYGISTTSVWNYAKRAILHQLKLQMVLPFLALMS